MMQVATQECNGNGRFFDLVLSLLEVGDALGKDATGCIQRVSSGRQAALEAYCRAVTLRNDCSEVSHVESRD